MDIGTAIFASVCVLVTFATGVLVYADRIRRRHMRDFEQRQAETESSIREGARNSSRRLSLKDAASPGGTPSRTRTRR